MCDLEKLYNVSLEVRETGFSINGREYHVGDILCYNNNPNKKGIILFGFYDNCANYEEGDYGCGFYVKEYHFFEGNWKTNNNLVRSIELPFVEEKETDETIIKAIKMLEI